MATKHTSRSLIEQVVHLDVETLDLRRGSGIHQIAAFDEATRQGLVIYPEPNLTKVTSQTPGQQFQLASSPHDIHTAVTGLRPGSQGWKDAILVRVLMDKQAYARVEKVVGKEALRGLPTAEGTALWSATRKEIAKNWPFLHESLLQGRFETRFQDYSLAQYNSHGAELAGLTTLKSRPMMGTPRSSKDVLSPQSDLFAKLRNKVILIANVDFESKQFGAQVAAKERLMRDAAQLERWSDIRLQKELAQLNPFRQVVAASSVTSPDVLYRTGAAYNEAVTMARQSGDWSGVVRPFVETARPGSVRDLLDLTRARQSMLQKLGFLKGDRPFGFSVDVTYRTLKFGEATDKHAMLKALTTKEHHEALLDISKHQSYILKKELQLFGALEQVATQGPEAKALLKGAERGEGLLWEAIKGGRALELFEETIIKSNLTQRYSRALTSFSETWLESIREGGAPRGVVSEATHTLPLWREQITPTGEVERVLTSFNRRKAFDNLDELTRFIATRPDYKGVNAGLAIENIQNRLIDEGALSRIEGGGVELTTEKQARRLNFLTKRMTEDARKGVGAGFLAAAQAGIGEGLDAVVTPPAKISQKFNLRLSDRFKKSQVKTFGLWAAGLSVAGAFWALKGETRRQREGPESLRILNYDKWLDRQSSIYGLQDNHMKQQPYRDVWSVTGLPKGGLAAAFRQQATDFGSPYQGPVFSAGVFSDLDLIQEREIYTQEAFRRKITGIGKTSGWQLPSRQRLANDPFVHPGMLANEFLKHSHATGINHEYFPGEEAFPSTIRGMRGQNLLQIDLSSNRWKVSVPDADTITLKRGGVTGAIQTFFGANKEYRFRLSGLDAPETAHGYKRAQPWAVAAKNTATHMVQNARNLQLVVNPKDITYGRQVATLFSDGRDLNKEFIRRGMADHLPFYKKDIKAMYRMSSYQAAADMAKSREIGMWSKPYWKAYRDQVAAGGITATFNQLNDIATTARSSNLMSVRGQMWQAQQQGFYNTASAIEAADLGKRLKKLTKKNRDGSRRSLTGEDFLNQEWMDTHTFATGVAPHRKFMNQMLGETSKLIKTKGTNEVINKFSTKRYRALDKKLAIDSTTPQNVWGKQKYNLDRLYGNEYERASDRKKIMEYMQQDINHRMFDSPIRHHRM